MAVVLDCAQRDAVWRFVVADLPDVGDIGRELSSGNVETAQRLRRRFDEDVRLLDVLGWSQGGERQSYEITMPLRQAEAIFARLHARIMGSIEEAVSVLLDQPVGVTLEAAGICTEVLRRLRGADGRPGRGDVRCLYEGPRRPDCG